LKKSRRLMIKRNGAFRRSPTRKWEHWVAPVTTMKPRPEGATLTIEMAMVAESAVEQMTGTTSNTNVIEMMVEMRAAAPAPGASRTPRRGWWQREGRATVILAGAIVPGMASRGGVVAEAAAGTGGARSKAAMREAAAAATTAATTAVTTAAMMAARSSVRTLVTMTMAMCAAAAAAARR
jgi:hypothetical protein